MRNKFVDNMLDKKEEIVENENETKVYKLQELFPESFVLKK